MKISEVISQFSVLLREPPGQFNELMRAVREGLTKDDLLAREKRLRKIAREAGPVFEWGGPLEELLVGKSGVGGGVEATPVTLSLLLIGYLLDCPRNRVADEAINMAYASYAPNFQLAHLQPWNPQPMTLPPGAVCKKTGARTFAGALIALLGDPKLLRTANTISVSADVHVGAIRFKDESLSQFSCLNPQRHAEKVPPPLKEPHYVARDRDGSTRSNWSPKFSFHNMWVEMLLPIVDRMHAEARRGG